MTPVSQGRFTISFTRPQTTTAVAKTESEPEAATSSKSSESAESSSLAETSSTAKEETSPQTPSVTPLPANYALEMTVDYQIKETTDYEWSVNGQVQNTGHFVVVTQKNSTELNQNVAQTLALAHEVMAVRLLVLFAIPLLLGNLFQQLYNTVDSLEIGRAHV